MKIIFLLQFLLFASCTYPLQHISPPLANFKTPKRIHMPYGEVYAKTADILIKKYNVTKMLYNRGIFGTEWYNYKYVSYPWGITQYRYRILARITQKIGGGYSIQTRVPIQKATNNGWEDDGRDKKIEKRVRQDIYRRLQQTN